MPREHSASGGFLGLVIAMRGRLLNNRLAAAIGAGLVAVILIGGIGLLTRSTDQTTDIASPTTSLSSATVASRPASEHVTSTTTDPATTTTTLGPLLLEWSRVPRDQVFVDAHPWAVAANDERIVAVGSVGFTADPEAWTSTDGMSWTRSTDPGDVFGYDQEVFDVIATRSGFVAVGETHGVGAAVWLSPDGTTWTRAPQVEQTFGEASIFTVTEGGPGLVAIGAASSEVIFTVIEGGAIGAASSEVVVWTSPDGSDWSLVSSDEADFGDGFVWAVAEGAPGLVAVGEDEASGISMVWTSPDGIAWSRVPHDESLFGNSVMRDVAALESGFVAVGWERTPGGKAVVWLSPDGIEWTRVRDEDAVFGSSSMRSVTATDVGLVAVGGERGDDENWDIIWTSRDGLIWVRLPDTTGTPTDATRGDSALFAITTGGPGVIAVGRDAYSNDAVVWTAPLD